MKVNAGMGFSDRVIGAGVTSGRGVGTGAGLCTRLPDCARVGDIQLNAKLIAKLTARKRKMDELFDMILRATSGRIAKTL
jgi:hypothetical protein